MKSKRVENVSSSGDDVVVSRLSADWTLIHVGRKLNIFFGFSANSLGIIVCVSVTQPLTCSPTVFKELQKNFFENILF